MRIPVCASLVLLSSCVIPPTPDQPKADIRSHAETVDVGALRLKVVSFERAGKTIQKSFQTLQSTHGFLVVDVEWKNLLDVPRETTFSPHFTLFCNGAEYAADAYASALLTQGVGPISFSSINPGSKRRSVVAFDAPEGRCLLRVLVPTSARGGMYSTTVSGPHFFFDLGEVATESVH